MSRRVAGPKLPEGSTVSLGTSFLEQVNRTFDRAAFGLIMEASRPVALNDVVTNP